MTDRELGETLETLIDHRGKTVKKLGGSFSDVGVPVVSAVNIKNGRIDFAQRPRFVSQGLFSKWMPIPLKAQDVILTSEAPLGEVALVPSDDPLVLGQRLFALRGKKGILDSRYLYYLLQWAPVQDQLQARSTGTTVVGIRQAELVKLRIPIIPLAAQEEAAAILGALDDKIESNSRLALTSRELAITYATDLLARCDGPLVPLEEVVTLTKGVSYRSVDLIEGGGWLVSLKCAGRDGSFQPDGLKPFSGPANDAQVVDEGDIVVAQTDITQRAEVIGRPIRVERLGFGGRLVASLDFSIVRPRDELSREVLLALLSQQEFRDHALGYCNGTTVLHMSSRALPSYQVSVPDAHSATAITALMKPLLQRSDVSRRENIALARLRNLLLPGLVSGELHARDAESVAEEAG